MSIKRATHDGLTQSGWVLCDAGDLSTLHDCCAGHLASTWISRSWSLASEVAVVLDGRLPLGFGGALGKECSKQAAGGWRLQGRGASENTARTPRPCPEGVPSIAAPSLVALSASAQSRVPVRSAALASAFVAGVWRLPLLCAASAFPLCVRTSVILDSGTLFSVWCKCYISDDSVPK